MVTYKPYRTLEFHLLSRNSFLCISPTSFTHLSLRKNFFPSFNLILNSPNLTLKFFFKFHTCGIMLTVQTHSSLRVALVRVSVTLARYTGHVRSSTWRDTCVTTSALFTKLSSVLHGACTILNVKCTLHTRNNNAPKKYNQSTLQSVLLTQNRKLLKSSKRNPHRIHCLISSNLTFLLHDEARKRIRRRLGCEFKLQSSTTSVRSLLEKKT